MRAIQLAAMMAILSPIAASGQSPHDANDLPRVNLALGYNYIRANAPPAECNCFSMNGGFASLGYTVRPWLAAAAEVTGSRSTNIGPLGQNLTLTTYTAGPRITAHYPRFTPFVQALFGAGHGSDSYFPRGASYSTSATSFAYTAGGGVDFKVSHAFDVRPQLQYLHTGFPNGTNDAQSHLVFGAAVVFKFGMSTWIPDPGRRRHKADKAMRDAEPAPIAPPPPPVAASAPPPPPPPSPPEAVAAQPAAATPPTAMPSAEQFHAAVPDAYFDYDSATLRPDATEAVHNLATWMTNRPALNVEIGGYADERGTQDYNLTLAARRAEVTRQALVAAGVSGARITTHSYGKLVQTCDEREESCYRQNRRAAFNLQP